MPSIIDRSRFLDEIARNPNLISRMASMVKGEVGLGGKDPIKEVIQLESAFNRAHIRGHSLQQSLLSKADNKDAGYYARDTYKKAATPEQIKYFQEKILKPVLAGSNEGEKFLGHPVTGNASQLDFAGKRLGQGVYAAGKWYGQPGGKNEMFVLEKSDARNLGRLGTGVQYAGLDQSNNATETAMPMMRPPILDANGNPIASALPMGVTLNTPPVLPPIDPSAPAGMPSPAASPGVAPTPAVAPAATPAAEPTLMDKAQAALMGKDGKAGPDSGASALQQIASGLRPKVDPAQAAAAATLTPMTPDPQAGGSGNSAQAQALLSQLLQSKRKPMGLTLTGGLV